MYQKSKQQFGSGDSLKDNIEGVDIYNSLLLYILGSPTISRESYRITEYQYRPDLIAKEFYGDTKYESYVLLQVGGSLEILQRGQVIQLIPKSIILSLVS